MNPIKVITDSTAYLTREYRKQHDIVTVPLTVFYGGETMEEGAPGEYEPLLEDMRKSTEFPKTSTPSMNAFYQVFAEAAAQGFDVIAVTLSDKLSGTYHAALSAAQMLDPRRVMVVDSLSGGQVVRFLLEDMWDKLPGYADVAAAAQGMRETAKRVGFQFTVASLEYLKRGGRLTAAQAMIGNLLGVKPIIQVKDGLLVVKERVRGSRHALERVIHGIPQHVRRINVCHVVAEAQAQKLLHTLRTRFPGASIDISSLGPVFGAHLGPGALGVCYLE